MKKDAQITIRLPSELKSALKKAAEKRVRTPNWLIVTILEAWVKKHPPR